MELHFLILKYYIKAHAVRIICKLGNKHRTVWFVFQSRLYWKLSACNKHFKSPKNEGLEYFKSTTPYRLLPLPAHKMAAWLPPWLCSWTLLWSYCQCGWSQRTRPSLTCSCRRKQIGFKTMRDEGDAHGFSKAHTAWEKWQGGKCKQGAGHIAISIMTVQWGV